MEPAGSNRSHRSSWGADYLVQLFSKCYLDWWAFVYFTNISKEPIFLPMCPTQNSTQTTSQTPAPRSSLPASLPAVGSKKKGRPAKKNQPSRGPPPVTASNASPPSVSGRTPPQPSSPLSVIPDTSPDRRTQVQSQIPSTTLHSSKSKSPRPSTGLPAIPSVSK